MLVHADFISDYQNDKSCIIVDVKILGIEKLNMDHEIIFKLLWRESPPSLKRRQTTQIGRVEKKISIKMVVNKLGSNYNPYYQLKLSNL